ncbi:hypothetical protein [Microbacterium allomyrinae]|uniref:Uncharacterized protein n=1 Tax=Microbacterium allomyrinae TaxID=2830666 RepID=A0A9X1LRQ7_9MICO|nr:hypothetical protein [Microbacterium allomyrinae]MCC2030892.1 hypothetical protein [Microbacterium allomyrinae]
MTTFWQSDAGEHIRLYRRRMASLRVTLNTEAPTKKMRKGSQEKARQALRLAFETDTLARYAREQTNWPKPRADIALDIFVNSASRNGARIDSACKWLLDELTGLVYRDDKQVKLLFARIGRPPSDPASLAFWGEIAPPVTNAVDPCGASISITAQPRSSVLHDLRVANNLEEAWDSHKAVYGESRRSRFYADFERDQLLDYQALFDPNDQEEGARFRQIANQIDYRDQAQQQQHVDLVFSSLFTELPVDRFGVWKAARSRLAYCPYIFDLGTLPERGETREFERRLRRILEDRRDRFPGLLPLRARSGVSMILFDKPGHSKDLDNLVRETLPAILDVLRPPRHDHQGWLADEPELSMSQVDIPFIEVASIPADQSDMPPGSLVLGLSSADRYSSWWSLVGDYVERSLDDI